MRALCLLKRSDENAVYPTDIFESFKEIVPLFHLSDEVEVDMPKLIGLIDRMASTVQVYRLSLIVKVVVSKKLKSFVALGSSCLSSSTMNRISCK